MSIHSSSSVSQEVSKRALVTGASEGIGRAFALRLAQEGWQVTAVARNEARLKELMAELPGVGHHYEVADLSQAAGVKRIESELSRVPYQLLINNAGFGLMGKFQEIPLAKFQEMMRLNCDALVALSHAFLKNARSGDSLINVSSTLAFLPFPMNGVYAATKAFVTSFSESLWFEQKERGIYVMNLCPGLTATQFAIRSGAGDRKLPKALVQSPEAVVDTAMRALRSRRQPTVISGGKNRTMANLTRLLPRRTTVSVMGRMEG